MDAEEPLPVEEERRRSRRSVRFILTVVLVSVVALVALGLWASSEPGTIIVERDGESISCPAGKVTYRSDEIRKVCEVERADAKEFRRRTALLVGAGVFVLATAVSTWPSRRLTGERLGPLR